MESAEAATSEFTHHSGDEPSNVDPSGSSTVVDSEMPAPNQNVVFPERQEADEVKSSSEQHSATENCESELKTVESTSMEVEAEHVAASESATANSFVDKSEQLSQPDSNQASAALVCEMSDNNIVMQKDEDMCVNESNKDVVDKNEVVHLVDDESSGEEEPSTSKVVDEPPATMIVDRKSPLPQQQQHTTSVDPKGRAIIFHFFMILHFYTSHSRSPQEKQGHETNMFRHSDELGRVATC